MDISCGNCATAIDETRLTVKCQPDLLPAVWHEKTAVVKGCKYFKPKYEEVKIAVVELIAEYYANDNINPIVVIARSADGRKFMVDKERIKQVRYHGWTKSDYFYEESENRYRRERWGNSAAGARYKGVDMVLSTKNEIGLR